MIGRGERRREEKGRKDRERGGKDRSSEKGKC